MKDSSMNKIVLEIAMKEFQGKKANDSIKKITENGFEISDRNEMISTALTEDAKLLNLSSEANEPDKPDNPDYSNITNEEFIGGIFGDLTLDRPIAVSFKGNPGEMTGKSWFGQAYIVGKTPLPTDANNYVSFATYFYKFQR